MKKCPYCAEQIQAEALKCRFCGEWLNKDVKPVNIEKKTPEGPNENTVVVDEEASGVLEEEPTGVKKKADEVPFRAPKKKIPWGWGWFILVGLFGMGFNKAKTKSFSDAGANYQFLIELLGIASVLLIYFWHRNMTIRKKEYAKIWYVSLMSGILSYLFVGVFAGFSLGIVHGIDSRAASKQFNATMEEMKTSAAQWNQEEEALWRQLALIPDTVQGHFFDSTNLIKRILSLLEKRKALMDRYFADYGYFIENSKDVALINKIQEFKKLTYDGIGLYRKCLESFIEHYSTGDEAKEEIAMKLLSEVDLIREKAGALSIEIQKSYPVR